MRRRDWVAVGAGVLVSAAADPGIREGVRQLAVAVAGVVVNPPLESEDPDTGEVETERVTRVERWQISRPLWTYRLGARELPCGCGRRIRMVWYAADCPIHMGDLVMRTEEVGDDDDG